MSHVAHDLVIESVAEFELALRRLWDRQCIFRGEDAPGYPLRPRFGRLSRGAEHAAECERAMLETFKARAAPLLSSAPSSDWEWLALAQHHGLATRLLDWTPNPLAAAFWAVQQPNVPGDRVLYVLDPAGIREGPLPGVSPFDVAEVVRYRPTYVCQDAPSECSVLTVHPEPAAPYEDARLERWVIRDETVLGICVTIDGYGTEEEAFAYADLGFVCRKLNWDWMVGRLSECGGVRA